MKKTITLTTLFLVLLTACTKKEKGQEKEIEIENTVYIQTDSIKIDSTLLRKSIALKHPSAYKDKLVYTVQIGAFSKRNPALEADANVSSKEEGSLIIYRYGNFDTYKEATAFKKSAKQLYPGAFIVSINKGERINIKQALQISNETVQ